MKKQSFNSVIAAILIAASLLTGCSAKNDSSIQENIYNSGTESQEIVNSESEQPTETVESEKSDKTSIESVEEIETEENLGETEYTYTRLKDMNSDCSNYGQIYFCINAAKYNYPEHWEHMVQETYTTKTRLTAKSSGYYCSCGEHEKSITEYLTASGDKWYFETIKN